jgi:vanillate O-demethylase ferredoxin subunit
MRFAETWMQCTVAAVRDVTPTIREFVLRPDNVDITSAAIGSHIQVGMTIGGRRDTRCYSMVGTFDPAAYRIAVRLAPDSRGGSRAMWQLAPGARLDVSSPTSLFEIDWTRKNYCLIAGGIGITPMLGIAAALARKPVDVTMHYAVRSRQDAAYLDVLSRLLGDRLSVHAGDNGSRLDLDATFASLPSDAIAIMCGPMRMLEAARKSWAASGRPASDLRFETFGSSGLLPTESFRVLVKDTGAEIEVPQSRSMLAVLNDAGFEVISDCQRGECGVCAIDVTAIDGEIDHRDVFFSDEQKHGNQKICPCVSRARGTVTVDTLYRRDAA